MDDEKDGPPLHLRKPHSITGDSVSPESEPLLLAVQCARNYVLAAVRSELPADAGGRAKGKRTEQEQQQPREREENERDGGTPRSGKGVEEKGKDGGGGKALYAMSQRRAARG